MYTVEKDRGKTEFICLCFLAQEDNQCCRQLARMRSRTTLTPSALVAEALWDREPTGDRQTLGVQYWATPSQQAAATPLTVFSSELIQLSQEFLCFPACLFFSYGSISLPSGLPVHSTNINALLAFISSLLNNMSNLTADVSEQLCTSEEEVFISTLNLFSLARSVLQIKDKKSTHPFQLCLRHSEVQRVQYYLVKQS